MPRSVVIYGRTYSNSFLFTHALRVLLQRYAERVNGCHFHLVFDSARDCGFARSILPPGRVTVHAQYQTMRPFEKGRTWPEGTVARWEQQYGRPNLRTYIHSERRLEHCSEDVKWKYLFSHIEYYEDLYQRTQPVLYVTGPADALQPWIGLEVFCGNGVPCAVLSPSRFGNRSFALDNAYEVLGIKSVYKEILMRGFSPLDERAAESLRQEYLECRVKPADHMAARAARRGLLPNPMRVVRVLRDLLFTDLKYFDISLRTAISSSLKARRTWLYDRYLRRKTIRDVIPGERFFFFPLHFEPEMSLTTMGKGWSDQVEAIQLISEALPIDCWLYVKEHPSMESGHRSIRFYRELLSLPRVRLLDQGIDSYAVISHAEAVVTITGTAGWEALMFGRPVALLGHSFYQEFEEGVVAVERPEDLPSILRALRHRRVSDDALRAYITAVLTRCRDGIFIEPRYYPSAAATVLSEQNLENIAKMILEHLDVPAVRLSPHFAS